MVNKTVLYNNVGISRRKSKLKQDYISIGKCAEIIGIDKSNLSKMIKREKFGQIELKSIRDPNKQNQPVHHITQKDFNRIKQIRSDLGFDTGLPINKKKGRVGYFYVVQTNPKHIPNRYKFGFTNDLNNRISAYKTVCPNAKLIKKWESESILEPVLLRMISKYGRRVGIELYEVRHIKKLISQFNSVVKKLY